MIAFRQIGSPNPKTGHTLGTAKLASSPNFDTMNAMEMLMKSGFGQGQAAAVIGAIRDAQHELVTKTDLKATKADLKVEIQELRSEMANQFAQLYRYLLIGAGVCITSLATILGIMMVFMKGV